MMTLALLLILAIAAVVFAWIATCHRESAPRGKLDFFSLPVLLGALFVVMYVIKPLFLLDQGWYGPALRASWKYEIDLYYFNIALALALVGILSFAIAYRAVSSSHREACCETAVASWRLYPFMIFSTVIGLATVLYLVIDAGGILSFLLKVRARHSFYEERGYLLPLLEFPKVAFLVYFCLFLKGRGSWLLLVPLGMVVILCDIAAAARAPFLLGTVYPIIGLYHYHRRRLNVKHILVFSMLFIMVFVGLRVATREISPRDLLSGETFVQERIDKFTGAIANLPEYLLGNVEVGMFDSLVRQTQGIGEGDDYLLGQSVFRLFLVIPKVIVGDLKPDRGNHVFTKAYYPGFYASGHAGITVSYIGDWFLNFGVIGVVAGMALLGALAGMVRDWCNRDSLFGPLLYLVSAGQFVILLRGDIQTMLNFLISVGLVAACIALIKVEVHRGSPQLAYPRT